MNNPNDIIEDLRLLHPANPWLLAGIGAGVVLLLVIGYFLWRRWRFSSSTMAAGDIALPQEDALAELEKARSLIKPGNSLAYGIAVSGIIRRHIERIFGIVAPRRTTEEFLCEAANSDRLEKNHRSVLAQFLACCDFMKFARGQAEIRELEALHSAAVRFVEETRTPVATEEAAP
jgi:hypothetical protein